MTKANSSEIIIVLDRSGSMQSIAKDMRGGFATFVEEQRKVPGECKFTLTQFDDEYEVVYEGKPVADVPALELHPRGSTALLDAIGRTISSAGVRLAGMKEEDRPSKVLCVIITDGQENASKEYNRQRVFDMIKTQKETYSWEFVFMGASQDAISVAGGLGIQNAVHYNASAGAGAQGVFRGISHNASNYRGGQSIGSAQDAYDATQTPDSNEKH